jgi:hypothetical protein
MRPWLTEHLPATVLFYLLGARLSALAETEFWRPTSQVPAFWQTALVSSLQFHVQVAGIRRDLLCPLPAFCLDL